MTDIYSQYEKDAFDHFDKGDWDKGIELAKKVPLNWDIWQRLPASYEIPDHAINKISDHLEKVGRPKHQSSFYFEMANNLHPNISGPTLYKLANRNLDSHFEKEAFRTHPNFALPKDESNLDKAHKFWQSYQVRTNPSHFATVKSMYSGKPETINFRGEIGTSHNSHTSKMGDTSFEADETWDPSVLEHKTYKNSEVIPHLQDHAKRAQDAVLKDKDIPKKMIDGEPHIELHRGVAGDYAKKIRDISGYDHDSRTVLNRNITAPSLPFSSWSTDKKVANNFAHRDIEEQPTKQGVVISKWFPVKSILSSGQHHISPTQDLPHADESEIMIGHPDEKLKFSTKEISLQHPEHQYGVTEQAEIRPHPKQLKKAEAKAKKPSAKQQREDIKNQILNTTYNDDTFASQIPDAKSAANLYRSYKHTPHQPMSLGLKYLVHRIENQKDYDKANSDPKLADDLDREFLKFHQAGDAGKKNGHIDTRDLRVFARRNSHLIPQILDHKDKLHKAIKTLFPDRIKLIDGEPHVALTRGLKTEQPSKDHALASYADKVNTGFGTHMHHRWVPMKNLYYSFDFGPKSATSEKFGNEDEFLVSPHKTIEATKEDQKPLKVTDKHSYTITPKERMMSRLQNPAYNDFIYHDLDRIVSDPQGDRDVLYEAMRHPKMDERLMDKALLHDDNFETIKRALALHTNATPNTLGKIIDSSNASTTHTALATNKNLSDENIHKLMDKAETGHTFNKLAQHPNLKPEHIERILDIDTSKMNTGAADNFDTAKFHAVNNPNASERNLLHGLSQGGLIAHQAVVHPNATPKVLSEALQDPNLAVNMSAIQHPNADKGIIDQAMGHKSGMVRRTALDHPKATLEHYQAALNDKEPSVRENAKYHLERNTKPIQKSESNPNLVQVKMGLNDHRKLRHELKHAPEHRLHKDNIDFSINKMGLNDSLDPSGHIHYDKVNNHIENSPSLDFNYEYSNDLDSPDQEEGKLGESFHLKPTDSHLKQLKDAGLLETFNKLPSIGSVKFTASHSPEGNDFHVEQPEHVFDVDHYSNALSQVDDDLKQDKIGPFQAESQIEEAEQVHPDKIEEVKKILFGQHKPEDVIHEAFLQHLRDKGESGSQIHRLQYSEPKSDESHGVYGELDSHKEDMLGEPTWKQTLTKSEDDKPYKIVPTAHYHNDTYNLAAIPKEQERPESGKPVLGVHTFRVDHKNKTIQPMTLHVDYRHKGTSIGKDLLQAAVDHIQKISKNPPYKVIGPEANQIEQPKTNYLQNASKNILLGYPVRINGEETRKDYPSVEYHATIRQFPENEDHRNIDEHAKLMSFHNFDPETPIDYQMFKTKDGSETPVITIGGKAGKHIKKNRDSLKHIGTPETYDFQPHISVDKETFEGLKNKGAKTLGEAGIEFGQPFLKKGPQIINRYSNSGKMIKSEFGPLIKASYVKAKPDHPFKVGDRVKHKDGTTGKVTEISSRKISVGNPKDGQFKFVHHIKVQKDNYKEGLGHGGRYDSWDHADDYTKEHDDLNKKEFDFHNTLSQLTQKKKYKGKDVYLMHKAVSEDEHKNNHLNSMSQYNEDSHWTPSYHHASQNARGDKTKIVSAWIKGEDMVESPNKEVQVRPHSAPHASIQAVKKAMLK